MTPTKAHPLGLAYRRLDTLKHLPRNTKEHDVGAIINAIREFGVLDPLAVNERTGHDLDGNGRLKALRAMMAENRRKVPKGVKVDRDGMWLAPVITGISLSPEKEERAAVALNRVQDLGGYDNQMLLEVLSDLAAGDGLGGTGYDEDDVDALLRKLNKPDRSLAETVVDPETVEHDFRADWVPLDIRLPPAMHFEVQTILWAIQTARGLQEPHEALYLALKAKEKDLTVTDGAVSKGESE